MSRLAKKYQSIGCILVLDETYYLFGSQTGVKILKNLIYNYFENLF